MGYLYKRIKEFSRDLAIYATGSTAKDRHFTIEVSDCSGGVSISIRGKDNSSISWVESMEEVRNGSECYHESLRNMLKEAGRAKNISAIKVELLSMFTIKDIHIYKE